LKILQNIYLYPEHVSRLNKLAGQAASFNQRIEIFKTNGLNGTHILEPSVSQGHTTFLTTTADPATQRQWAVEHGLPPETDPYEILAAQIAWFKPDVFYTHGTGYFPESVLKKLLALCQTNVCWKGPPDVSGNLQPFKLLVNNFPSSLPQYQAMANIKTGYHTPSFDHAMEPHCFNIDRPVDIIFAGSYSRRHRRRAEIIEALSTLPDNISVAFHLSFDRLSQLANSPFGILPGLRSRRANRKIRQSTQPPVFGTDMYHAFSRAKIVINCAIDVAGEDRGNIRCFEAMGCGALLVSDAGNYPPKMENGVNMLTYTSVEQLIAIVTSILADEPRRAALARNGLDLLRGYYSKEAVWNRFNELLKT
jgi:hypothetical protein